MAGLSCQKFVEVVYMYIYICLFMVSKYAVCVYSGIFLPY